jgi:hypothetical protein
VYPARCTTYPSGDVQNPLMFTPVENPGENTMAFMETWVVFDFFNSLQAIFFNNCGVFSHSNLLLQ